MNRRQVLAGIGGVGASLSGCLDGGAATTQPTDAPTPAVESQVEVPPCPERPDSFTRETALQFATQFEKSYRIRRTLREREHVVSIFVEIREALTEKTATRTDEGWLVRFTVLGPAYRYRPTPSSTQTAHVDPSMTVAHYLLTDRTVFRAVSLDTVDPREAGSAVQCPPE